MRQWPRATGYWRGPKSAAGGNVAHPMKKLAASEETLLGAMNDSVFKNERLHAIQMYETNLAYTKLHQLNQKLEESKSQETVLTEKLQKSCGKLLTFAVSLANPCGDACQPLRLFNTDGKSK